MLVPYGGAAKFAEGGPGGGRRRSTVDFQIIL